MLKNLKVNSSLLINGGNIDLPESRINEIMKRPVITQNDQMMKNKLIEEIRAKTRFNNN